MSEERLLKARYRVIRANSTGFVGAVDWPRQPRHSALRALLEEILEADPEHVSVLADFDCGRNFIPTDMFVDDCGRRKGLPRNEEATTIYRRAAFCGRAACPIPNDPEELGFIVGTAIIFDRRVWF